MITLYKYTYTFRRDSNNFWIKITVDDEVVIWGEIYDSLNQLITSFAGSKGENERYGVVFYDAYEEGNLEMEDFINETVPLCLTYIQEHNLPINV